MRDLSRFGSAALAAVILFPTVTFAAAPTREQAEFFEKKVRPILVEQCFKCHSEAAKKNRGGLVVDSIGGLLKGGDTGPALTPGKPEASLLIKAVKGADKDLQMPPKEKLSAEQVAVLEQWVKQGAPWPGATTSTARAPGKITDEDRRWWAFQPLRTPVLPEVKDANWARNPIDRFIFTRLQAEGLTPAPAADRAALVRRVYFDLIGLPPTPTEMEGLLNDKSDRWYETLVDKLLASPRYGERWARHWLDLVRYAESDGYRIDDYRPTAWRYRQYVIDAFNKDKPYNRFVAEQLAGDEIAPDDPDALAATGFLNLWIYEYNQRDVRTQWAIILDDITDVTADVFLGLGMGCAKCHDHKFDPILQKDYYRLQAFFAPILPQTSTPLATPAQLADHRERQRRWEEKTADIRKQMDAIEGQYRKSAAKGAVAKFPEEIQGMINKATTERPPLEHQLAELAYRQVYYEYARLDAKMKDEHKQAMIALRKQLGEFEKEKPAPLPTGLTVRDVGAAPPPTVIPKKNVTVEPGYLTLLDEAPAKIDALPNSTGRRSTLARWITRPENPLTTRVIVNRVWQYHFGRGIVGTSSDFGKLGDKPTHPELLDYLAQRFQQDGWSFKQLHRLILTSNTYRQAARHPNLELALKKDPDNLLLWHMGTRRLDAEQIRDSVLSVTGELDLHAGGPSVEGNAARRTIYSRALRNSRDALLDVFDVAEGIGSTAQRNVTTTPTQSLLMFNNNYLLQRSKALAARLQKASPDDGQRIEQAFRLVYGREPTAAERSAALGFLSKQSQRVGPQPQTVSVPFQSEKIPFRDGRGATMQRDTTQARFQVPDNATLPTGDFTIEAFILLRSVAEDAQVRTIASHWSGDRKQPGWSIGVTGKKSAFKPQTVVLQMFGDPAKDGTDYEAIFSGLHIALNKPYYVAVSVHLGDAERKGVTFHVKDLSNDDEPMQSVHSAHKSTGRSKPKATFTIGGTDGKNTPCFDGAIDDVRLSSVALPNEKLLLTADGVTEQTVGYWQFEKNPGVYQDSSQRGNHILPPKAPTTAGGDARTAALVDFCHVLLNSNEFLYLD